MSSEEQSRQVRRTRRAILDAFRDLILKRSYADIRVSDIIERADVGRSTFYEHFRNKDDLFRASFSGVVAVVADTVREDCDLERLQWVLEHFHHNQRLARNLLRGDSYHHVVSVLASLIEERLTDLTQGQSLSLSLHLAAAHIAGAHFGLIRAWLQGSEMVDVEEMASTMHRSARAMLLTLINDSRTGLQ